jgi:hypothetical protein
VLVFTRMLLFSVTVEVVAAWMALLPQLTPVLVPFRYTVLKRTFTFVPPVMFIPIKLFGDTELGVRRSPIRLFCKFTVVPPPERIPEMLALELFASQL